MEQHKLLCASTTGFHQMTYTTWGQTEATPLICVHGLTRNGRDFDLLADALSLQGRHVICPDIVGRGESDWLLNPANYGSPQYIADLTALLARLNVSSVDWLGTSMGGLIGMFIAAMKNTPIRRLILNDIGPYIPGKALTRLAKYVDHQPIFSSIAEAEQYFRRIHSPFGVLTDQQWHDITIHSIRQNEAGQYVEKMDPAIHLSVSTHQLLLNMLMHPMKAMQGTAFDIDFWSTWQQIQCPVLVIRGAKSDLLRADIVDKMYAIHPNTEVVVIPDVGHAPALMDAAQIGIVSQWLSKPITL